MWPEWKTRINPAKKEKLMAELRKQAEGVNSEAAIKKWVSEMDIPEHIKEAMRHKFWLEALHCGNFEGICEFDVKGNVSLTLEILQEFL